MKYQYLIIKSSCSLESMPLESFKLQGQPVFPGNTDSTTPVRLHFPNLRITTLKTGNIWCLLNISHF